MIAIFCRAEFIHGPAEKIRKYIFRLELVGGPASALSQEDPDGIFLNVRVSK